MAEDTKYRKLQKKAFAICNAAGLSRIDRLDLARELLKIDRVESFNDLSEREMDDLCFGLEAWDTVQKLREANGSLLHEAKHLVAVFNENFGDDDTDYEEEVASIGASLKARDTEVEDPEPIVAEEAQEASEEAPVEAEEDAVSPEIASEFASTRRSRKRG